MTAQLSVAARNARLDAIETELGASPILHIRSGAPPANCAAANSGTLLATLNLPADAFLAASSGQKAKSGTWSDGSADGTGTAGHFRFFKSDGVTCVLQGTVTATGGGGDMEVLSTAFTAGMPFEVTAFTMNEPNS